MEQFRVRKDIVGQCRQVKVEMGKSAYLGDKNGENLSKMRLNRSTLVNEATSSEIFFCALINM